MAFITICKVSHETENEAQRFVDKNTTPEIVWEIEEDPPPVVMFSE